MAAEIVARNWLSLTVEDESDVHDGLWMAVEKIMRVLYVDDGLIRSRYLEWLQVALSVLARLFCRVGLMLNVENSKTMTFQPGAIHTGMS